MKNVIALNAKTLAKLDKVYEDKKKHAHAKRMDAYQSHRWARRSLRNHIINLANTYGIEALEEALVNLRSEEE